MQQTIHPVSLADITVEDAFWSPVQETVRTAVLPYQWEALNDRVPGAAPSYCMHNFRAAARLMQRRRTQGPAFVPPRYTYRGFETLPDDPAHPDPDRFYGFVFQDTDFSKWIEAVAYTLVWHPDPELEATADAAIDQVCAAQHESGYLDTYYIINGMDRALSYLKDHHELYCLGHLIEGAVAYYEATGKDKLLHAACRFADYVADRFGPGPDQCHGYPGHEVAEMALFKLYEVTGEERYLKLGCYFLDQRGTQPYYFDEETTRRAALDGESYRPNEEPFRYAYYQAHQPVKEQREAVGHAVRAGYLYSGMADAARLTGDAAMYEACQALWRNIVDQKLYITGGVGGTHIGEAFSRAYDLPNDTAYSETCAAIALVFFARRMLQLTPKAEYADVMERALYNTVPAGMALDGRSFFYVNPLQSDPDACRRDARLSHVKPTRQPWFGCACCPPNIARLVASLGSYAYTADEKTLWVHLYLGGTVRHGALKLAVQSGLPWQGRVVLTVQQSTAVETTVALRRPGWAEESASLTVPPQLAVREQDGYWYLTGVWNPGDKVELTLPMPVRCVAAHPAVREDARQVAFTRGPLVYCAEQVDNGPNLHLLRVNPAASVAQELIQMQGRAMTALTLPVRRIVPTPNAPLYAEYRPPVTEQTALKLVPYFAWANRGEGEMRVWLYLE